MADISREKYGFLVERALGHAQQERARQLAGEPPRSAEEIADQLRRKEAVARELSRREVIREVNRAIRAYELGLAARTNPQDTPRRIDVPFNRSIKANESEYQYRSIVVARVNGVVQPGAKLVVFGSGDLLTGDEIVRRAMRQFQSLGVEELRNYPTAIKDKAATTTFQVLPLAITRFEPLR